LSRAHWQALDQRIEELEKQIKQIAQKNEATERLQKIVGVGTITASAVTATVIDGRQFKNGREFAASIG
jgi:transposase